MPVVSIGENYVLCFAGAYRGRDVSSLDAFAPSDKEVFTYFSSYTEDKAGNSWTTETLYGYVGRPNR